MSDMEKKVVAVLPLEDYKLVVWFAAGVSKVYDARRLVSQSETFAPLSRPAVFKRVRPMPEGAGITWGSGMNVLVNDLYAHGKTIDLVESEKHRLLDDLAQTRRESDFSQMRLGEAAGIRQPVISRIEGGDIAPQINTLFKLLTPMGKTLAIVDLDEVE